MRDIHYLLVSNFNLLLTSVKLITLEGNCLSFKLVQPSPSQFTVAVPSGHWHLPSVQTSALITEPKTRVDYKQELLDVKSVIKELTIEIILKMRFM